MSAPTQTAAPLARGPDCSPGCGDCPLFRGRGGRPSQAVAGEGPRQPDWIIVGEGPGRTEAMYRRPFMGPSGALLNQALASNHVERERLWITNATLCEPQGASDDDLAKARRQCAPRLHAELVQFPGVPVLGLGAVAMRTFLDEKAKITQVASSLHDVDVDGSGPRPFIPTHHPARILRGGDGAKTDSRAVDALFLNLLYDIGKIAAIAAGRPVRFVDDTAIAVDDPELALQLTREIVADVLETGMGACDVETDALNARKANLTAIATSTVNRSVSVAYPLLHANTAAGRESWRLLQSIWTNPDIQWVFHNRIYDELVLWRYGITFAGPRDDTMLMHHSAFPGAPHDLQAVATQFFAITPWKAEFRAGRDESGKPASVEALLAYNAKDALATARLVPRLEECLNATDAWATYETDNGLTPTARAMEVVGIPIHYGRNRELHKRFSEVITRIRNEIETPTRDPTFREAFIDRLAVIVARKMRKGDPPDFLSRHKKRFDELFHGVRKKKDPTQCLKGKEPVQFDIGNDTHIAAYLQAKGHRLVRVTPTGKPSTAKDTLEEMTHIAEVRDILAFREARKLDSTFVDKLPTEGSGDFRRAHPSWDLHKITGRWGSSPNFQNWPKANQKGRPNLREQVVAPPGRAFVGADFAQLEARIIAMISADEFLWSVFMAGYGECAAGCDPFDEPVKFCPRHDVHTVFAVEVFPGFLDMKDKLKKELRDLVKRGEYGGFYGGAIETLYASIVKEYPHVTLADVAKIVRTIAQRMPGVARWHQDLLRQAVKEREIRSAILGRRRTFPLGNADMNVIYNFPCQATGADIVDLGILEMEAQLPADANAFLLIQGHDSVVLECDADAADEVALIVTKALTQEHTYNGTLMRYPAQATVASCWADL